MYAPIYIWWYTPTAIGIGLVYTVYSRLIVLYHGYMDEDSIMTEGNTTPINSNYTIFHAIQNKANNI